MKKYYLVAEKDGTHTTVKVSDSVGVGRVCLMELEAASFADAVKMVSFSAAGCGKTAICGVARNGQPYAEIC